MTGSSHLLLPLASSVVFVIAGMLARRSGLLGVRAFTNTILANLSLAIAWSGVAIWRNELLPLSAWGYAVAVAASFVIGQLCTYLAFQLGDVSLATPVFGIKIVQVAILSSLVSYEPIGRPIWIAAVVAALGVAVVQAGGGRGAQGSRTWKKTVASVGFAFAAATTLSLFDIGLQKFGRQFGPERFLATMFIWTGVLSLGLLPWADGPARIRQLGASRPLVLASLLMAAQAVSISYALSRFGDATRVNIVYATRGLWSVLLAWLISRGGGGSGVEMESRTLLFRLGGAVLLMISVVIALL